MMIPKPGKRKKGTKSVSALQKKKNILTLKGKNEPGRKRN